MRRSARLVISACLLLALTACSGGGDDDEPEAEPSPSAETSATATESPSESPTAEASYSPTVPVDQQVADPCALLDEPDYAPLLVKKARSLFAEQITQYGTFATCRTYAAVFTPLRFGFSIDPEAYDDAYAELAPAKKEKDTRKDIDLGDRAFISERPGDGIEVYVESGGVTFMIDHAVGTFGMSSLATGNAADVQAAAERMLEIGDGKISDVAILLPENCPSTSGRVVQDLIGTVAWGRGGTNPDGISACGYAGEDGGELRASYTFLTPGYFDVEYGYGPFKGDVVVDPKPGIYKRWSRAPDGSYNYLVMFPDHVPQLELELTFSGMKGPEAQVTKKFLAWANGYLRSNAPKS